MSKTRRNIDDNFQIYETGHKSEIREKAMRGCKGSKTVPDGMECPNRMADNVVIDDNGKAKYDYWNSDSDFHASPEGHRFKKRETKRKERRFGREMEKAETNMEEAEQ